MRPNCTAQAFMFHLRTMPRDSIWSRLKALLASAAVLAIALPVAVVLFALVALASAATAVTLLLRRSTRREEAATSPAVIEAEYTVVEEGDRKRDSRPDRG